MAESRKLLRQIMVRLDEMEVALRAVCAEVKRIQDIVEERGVAREETKSSTSIDDILAPTPREVHPPPFVLDNGISTETPPPISNCNSISSSSCSSDFDRHGLPLYLPSAQLVPSHALSRQGESILETILRTDSLHPTRQMMHASSSGDTWCSNAVRIDQEDDDDEQSSTDSSVTTASNATTGTRRTSSNSEDVKRKQGRRVCTVLHEYPAKSAHCQSYLTPPAIVKETSNDDQSLAPTTSVFTQVATSNALIVPPNKRELHVPEITVTTEKIRRPTRRSIASNRSTAAGTLFPCTMTKTLVSEESGEGKSWSVEGSIFSVPPPERRDTSEDHKTTALSPLISEPSARLPVTPARISETPTSLLETAPTRLSETAPTRPSETAPTRLSETAPTRLSETAPTRLSETAPTRSSETAPRRSSETAPARHSETPPVRVFETAPAKGLPETPADEEKVVRSFLYDLLDNVVNQQAKLEADKKVAVAIDTFVNHLIDGVARSENGIEGLCLI